MTHERSVSPEETIYDEKTPTSSRASPAPGDKEAAVADLPVLESQNVMRVAPVQTHAMKRKALFQFTTLCLSIYVSGWNDGTIGPLLPRLQAVYHVCCPLAFYNVTRADTTEY